MIRDFFTACSGRHVGGRLLLLGILGWLLLTPAATAQNQEDSTQEPPDAETLERLKAMQITREGEGFQLSTRPTPTTMPQLRVQFKPVARTELAICPHAGACAEGPWVQEIGLDSGASDTTRTLRWSSSGSGAIKGRWQVATQPFSEGAGLQFSSVLAEGTAGTSVDGAGEFQINFTALPSVPPTGGSKLQPTRKKLTPKAKFARTLYLRVVASANGQAVGPPSKAVVIHVGPRPPAIAMGGQTRLAMKTDAGRGGSGVYNWAAGDEEVHVGRSGDTSRWFRWATTSLPATEGVWQVSKTPFPDHLSMDVSGIRSAGPAGTIIEGRVQLQNSWYRGWQEFPIDVASLENAITPPVQAGGAWNRQNLTHSMQLRRTSVDPMTRLQRQGVPAQWKEWFLSETYHIRVVPMARGVPVAPPSNSIPIRFGGAPPPPNSQYRISTPPDIFHLEFGFSPVRKATLGWGCIQIRSVDAAWHALVDKPIIGPKIAALIQASQTGAPICPEPYERPWYFSFWDFASGVVDRISKAFSAVKSAVVNVLADAIPGNLCDSTCRAGLMMGLNAGLVALGIPPEIPSLSALTEQGMDYLVETAVAEGPVGCGLPCREAVRAGIELFAEETQRSVVQSYQDEELAHSLGFEPIWVPAGVTAVPHPDSGDRPAKLTLQVTRRPQPVAVDPGLMRRYLLDLRFACRNESVIGRDVTIPYCCQQYGSACFECPGGSLRLERAIQGNLFAPVSVPIPPLSPGQSVVMPMVLDPENFWIPDRVAEIRRVGGFAKYNDWQILYEGGALTITASIQDAMYSEGTRHQHLIGRPLQKTVQLAKIR